jgi:hypothetical protein
VVGLTAAAGSFGSSQLFVRLGYPAMSLIGAAIAAALLMFSFTNGRRGLQPAVAAE